MMRIVSQETGSGMPILLIHGFPFNQTIWDDFGPRLSNFYNVITVDLPGFGKSPNLPKGFTLGHVADALIDFLHHKNLTKVSIIGHSLGGYVALAIAKQKPDICASLGLFHSTAYADSPEKKESRSKVIDFVNKNGAVPFTTGFIPPLFAKATHPAIEKVKEIASQATAEAVIGYTLAMKDRPEEIKTLERFENPTLFIAGKEDPGIPVDSVLKQSSQCKKPQIHVLEEVAHMGMYEKPAETAQQIKDFVSKTYASF